MSQSPRNLNDSEASLRYDRAWLALNTLLRQGMSFSGRERNRCFLNLGSATFADVSFVSGLGMVDDGRAVAAVDWDFDGDVDVWTSNATSPRLRYLENNYQGEHHFVGIRLQGTSSNRDAIGARVEVYTSADSNRAQIKSLRAGDAFLSQSTKWIHFGLGNNSNVDRVVVRWPGGVAEPFHGVGTDGFWHLVQGSGRATPIQRHAPVSAKPSSQKWGAGKFTRLPHRQTSSSVGGRVVLLNPVPLPELDYHTLEQPSRSQPLWTDRPTLLSLWATWCAPCMQELATWNDRLEDLSAAGLNVVALCVDQHSNDPVEDAGFVRGTIQNLHLRFPVGLASLRLIRSLDIAQRTFTPAQRPLPLPCSFLLDGRGQLAVVYTGGVSVDQLVHDSRLLGANRESVLASAIPFAGQWLQSPEPLPLRRLALALYEAGEVEAAKDYIHRLISVGETRPLDPTDLLQLYRIQGAMLSEEGSVSMATAAFRQVLRLDPGDQRAHLELANLALSSGELASAAEHVNAAISSQPNDPSLHKTLGAVRMRQGRLDDAIEAFHNSLSERRDPEVDFALGNALVAKDRAREAIDHFESALRQRPGWPPAANNLAWILATHNDPSLRNGRRAVQLAAQACRATNQAVPDILLTHAAALAEIGRFDKAVSTVQSAIELAQTSNNSSLVDRAQSQLRRYRASQPFRSANETADK